MRKQKKVLILGGTRHMIGIVEAARRMGHYTIVVDNGSSSLTKRYADELYDFNPSDTSTLAKLAADEKVEGIFTAIDDSNVWNAIKLCKTAGLPMFASHEQMNMGGAKDKFLEFCKIFQVPVVQEQELIEDSKLRHVDIEPDLHIPFIAYWEDGDVEQPIELSHKVKLYYTLHHKNYWGTRRTRLFIKAPGREKRRSAAIYARAGNKAVREQVFQ